jgi:pyruvate,orthophosphate dikinase
VPKVEGQLTPAMVALLKWADEIRTLGVYANADTPGDAEMALSLGAEGIGLCRTEHMFFDVHRIRAMRKMILAGREDVSTREQTLGTLLAYQREDFVAIFSRMGQRPVVVRLLDPPLHEFLPHVEEDQKDLARELGLTLREVRRRIRQLGETNPMLGHRGCRLLVTYPEILQMQVRAIIEAAIECAAGGIGVKPSLMIPLTIGEEEMKLLARQIRVTADQVMREKGLLVEYAVGSMIETPRAALLAGEIARHAQFLSFGTNDLTQTTLAVSRDDAGSFLGHYEQQHLVPANPFRTLDEAGVGELVKVAIQRGRQARSDLTFGVCGEHGGDPASIAFFHGCGVDYVSCSPLRLPIARLAAAHAVLHSGG